MDALNAFWSQYSGFLLTNDILLPVILAFSVILLSVGYFGLPFIVWALTIFAGLIGFGAPVCAFLIFAGIALVFMITPIRRMLVSSLVMKIMKALQLIPHISATERTALEAGVVWMEAELFSGHPNFKKMLAQPIHKLSSEEQSFLDTEVNTLCGMIDDYHMYKTKVMKPEVWEYIRRKGFLGMIIPKEYGGLAFSHSAHSAVIQKISSRSIAAAIYAMVPNSLGPAALLVRY